MAMWWEKKHPAPKGTSKPAPTSLEVEPPPKPDSPQPHAAVAEPFKNRLEYAMTEMTTKPPFPVSSNLHQTTLGGTVVLHGELSGNEDLLIEGKFEGSISLKDHCLTVGQQGQVKADIEARQVVVGGTVNGKVSARDKVEIKKTGHVVGDLVTAGVAIEEGAYFKGSIEILREEGSKAARTAVSSVS